MNYLPENLLRCRRRAPAIFKSLSLLIAQFLQLLPARRLTNKTEIVIAGDPSTIRVPDLIVLSEELEAALQGRPRSTIMLDMPPPLLVVEVASPGKRNQDRDYRYKRSEYSVRGIVEYRVSASQRLLTARV